MSNTEVKLITLLFLLVILHVCVVCCVQHAVISTRHVVINKQLG